MIPPLNERFAAFLEYAARERELSPATVAAYRRDLAALERYAEGAAKPHPLEAADPDALVDYLAWERNRGLSDGTLRRRLATLRSYLTFAALEGYPEARLRPPRLPQHPDIEPRSLSEGVVERLLTTARLKVEEVRLKATWRELAAFVAAGLLRSGVTPLSRLWRLERDDFDDTAIRDEHLSVAIEALKGLAGSDGTGRYLLEPLNERSFRRLLKQLPGGPTPSELAKRPTDEAWDGLLAGLRGRLRHLRPKLDLGFPCGSSVPEDYRTALRDCALFELLYAAGLRISEALGLVWRRIDLKAGYLRIRGKGGRSRVLPLGEVAAGWLRRLERLECSAGAEDPVFVASSGAPLDRVAVYRRLRKLAAEAGVEAASPHQLRHSFATHMLAGGAEVRLVSELLGHRQLSETQRYTRVEVSRLRKAHRRHPRESGGGRTAGER